MFRMRYAIGLSGLLLIASFAFGNIENQGGQPDFVNDFFKKEFNDLQDRIATSKSLKKSGAGEPRGAILDSQALIFKTDRDPLDVVQRRTEALLADLRKGGLADFNRFEARLSQIKLASSASGLGKTVNASAVRLRQDLYMQTMALQREIALANPLMDFDSLLFVATRFPNVGDVGHIIQLFQGHIFGNMAGDGQGLFLIKGLKSDNPTAINIVANSTVQNEGRFKNSKLSGGAFLSPDLSYDGKTIIFAWRQPGGGIGPWSGSNEGFNKEFNFHIFKVNVDGSNLIQLTDGNYNDFDPCWLPNGRIAFVTERRGGFGRCHGGWQGRTFTIFSMKSDGTDMYCIDYHETNEWQPSVDNSGKIVYSRWDYVDRDAIVAHNMWTMSPDGCDSRSYHGNYPIPWSTIPGSDYFDTADGRLYRPMTEFYIRSIPNSMRYVATVTGHHVYPFGDIVLIDPTVPDDNKNSQITGITTDRTIWYDKANPSTYGTTWPLSEGYFICSYNSDIVLLDKTGNRQVLFSASKAPGVNAACRCQDPVPLRPRKKPLEITPKTYQGERKTLPDHKRAVLSVMDVRNSDMPLPAGVKIKELRIVQIFPKTTVSADDPRTNYALQALCRMSLGTVPVEKDGSVYCEAPVGKSLYFQILDERGCAVQSMRSDTWVHEGEHLTCAGCHEDKWKSAPTGSQPLALQRAPSKLKPEYGASVEPLTFYRTAKPVFDAQCAPCHKQQGKGPTMSYGSLQKYAFCYQGIQDSINIPPRNGIYAGSRTTPGKHGAVQSLLFSHLGSTHHDVKLSPEETRKVTLWLDLCSMELGAYTGVNEQRVGQVVWPDLDCDPKNPQGIENDFPSPEVVAVGGGDARLSSVQPLEMRINGTSVTIANPHRTDVRISLFDLTGRCVYSKTFGQRAAKLSVDMRNWPIARGIYVLRAFAEKSCAIVMAAKVD